MIVCHCLAITDRDLKRAASKGPVDQSAVPARLAGSCCGGCKPMVLKLLQSYSSKQATEPRETPAAK